MSKTSYWIGVDLDKTLAYHDKWDGDIGEPIPKMLERVKRWLAKGKDVRILTARVAASGLTRRDGSIDDQAHADTQRALIQDWTEKHLGVRLPVTATKDFAMIELWDDKAVQVIPNTGIRATSFQDVYNDDRSITHYGIVKTTIRPA